MTIQEQRVERDAYRCWLKRNKVYRHGYLGNASIVANNVHWHLRCRIDAFLVENVILIALMLEQCRHEVLKIFKEDIEMSYLETQ